MQPTFETLVTVKIGSDAFHVVESAILFHCSVLFELIQLRDKSHCVLGSLAIRRFASDCQQELAGFVYPALTLQTYTREFTGGSIKMNAIFKIIQ